MKEVYKMELGVHVTFGSFHYFEIRLFFKNKNGEPRFNVHEITASKLKELGVIKRSNGYKKIREWLTTDEAKQVMKELTDKNYNGESPFVFI